MRGQLKVTGIVLKTIVMITHDKEIAKHGSRIVNILDGKLTEHKSHNIKEENNNGGEQHV